MDQPVTINTAPEEDAPIYLEDNTSPQIVPEPPIANLRAQKANIGLGETLDTTENEIQRQILSGREQQFRQAAASRLDSLAAQKLEKQLIDYRKQKGSPLTAEDATNAISPSWLDSRTLFNQTNPLEVIEQAYGQKFISMANTAASTLMPGGTYQEATREVPEQVALGEAQMSKMITHVELARTLKEDVDAEIKNQGYVPWLFDEAKTMFQPYMEFKMRGLVPDAGGLLLGTNLKNQADKLIEQPTSAYREQLMAIVSRLRKDNPLLASKFLEYVIGTSTNEQKLDNIFTVLQVQDYASLAGFSRSLLRKIELNNRVNQGFKQVIKDAAKSTDPNVPVKAAVQEALGDVQGAAQTKAADHIAKAMSGKLDPVQDAKESLPSIFKLDGEAFATNHGPLSVGEATEIKDSFWAKGVDLYDRIVNMLRVMRTPVSVTSQQAIAAWKQVERAKYAKEGLLDIGDPVHMPETNTYHVPYTFGNQDGRLLSDPETAYNYARNRGYADPRIVPAEGEVEKVPGKLAGSKTDLNNKARLEKSIPTTERFVDRLKEQVSAKGQRAFIGPRQPGEIDELKATYESAKEILKRDKGLLADINKRVISTEPVIEQHGLGYKITVIRPYNETDPIVRQFLLNDKKAKSASELTGWGAWKNATLGWIRSADDTLAYNESMNRKIATYTQSVMKEWAKDEARNIEAIANQTKWYTPWTWHRKFTNKEQFQQFNQALKAAKDNRDKNGDLGAWFKNPQELDDFYQRYFQRNVTFPEVKAYFSHVKLVEANRVLSEIAEFRNRARLGTEQHQIFMIGANGAKIASGFFDGIEHKEFPGGEGQIIVFGSHKGDEKIYNLGTNEIPGEVMKRYREQVKTGKAKIIQLYDVGKHPLQDFTDLGRNRVKYVMTSDSEFKPIDFNHINRREGGHFEVDADWYVKQADFIEEMAGDAKSDKRRTVRKLYNGDKTLFAQKIRAEGTTVVRMMNQMNEFIRDNKVPEAQDLARRMGIEWTDIQNWYNPERYENGKKVGPWLDHNEPFYLVPRNRRILDLPEADLENRVNRQYGSNIFRDASKTDDLSKQFQVEYSQARDSELMNTVRNIGDANNPIFKMELADYVDPIPTMSRALNRVIRSTFMDDYKIHAVEHWLQEAMPYLKASPEEIRSAPFWHFNNADKGAFLSGTPIETYSSLLSNRWKIQQFVGMPNVVETSIHRLTQLLTDQFYNKFGPEEGRNVVTKAFTVVPLWALSKWQDPISGVRSLAFNAKLGVFALPQFLVQAQTFANIWALGGRAAGAGTYASMLHQWSRINASESFLRAYDDYATKLNVFGSRWRPGEWMEARKEFNKTGFEHVGTEYQLADDQMQHNFFKGTFNNFLDAGQVFFREGEKFTRIGAYYTAFREFRDVNPTKVLTDADRAQILQKADLYTANMSRASASMLNSSIFSLPMQFLTYQVRMAELFWGKRLGETAGERALNRARLMGMYAALYGAPGALGVTGFPFMDSVREAAINKGYVPGDNQLYDNIMNGTIAWQLAMVSGGFDYKKGNQYDVQGRWGTQGLSVLRESLRSDKPTYQILLGAGPDTFISTVANIADPFWQFVRQVGSDDEEGNTFKITPQHLMNIMSEVSSVDLATRGIYAIHSGRWVAKNGSYIEDVTPADSIFRMISGFKSQDQSDILLFRDIHQKEKDAQASAERKIVQEYRRGMDAARDKDYDTATTMFTNARARMIAAGIPLEDRARVLADAMKGFESQSMSTQWDWANKHVPAGDERTRLEAFGKRQAIRDYRNQ